METKPDCETTHRQLLSGSCPWCHALIINGHVASSSSVPQPVADDDAVNHSSKRVWDIAVLEADLSHADPEHRLDTVTNLLHHGPPLDEMLPLLSKALSDSDDHVRYVTSHELFSLGADLSPEQASEFEAQVDTSKHQLALRFLLVSFYFLGRRESESAALARRSHILWLIEHAATLSMFNNPYCYILELQDPEGYRQAKSLWISQVQANPNNPTVLANAAGFFTLSDKELSEQLLQQGRTLKPDNPYWSGQLGQLYALQVRRRDNQDSTTAARSFAAYEESEQLRLSQQVPDDPDMDKFRFALERLSSLLSLAKSACDAAEFEKATNYASELLSLADNSELPEHFRNDGNAVHHGNLVLGRVAVAMGDIEEGKRRLIAAGNTAGSPQLNSFGPNMCLALELLERGEKDIVLKYFSLCSKFWKNGSDRLEAWANDIAAGNIPTFGANLRY